jgi:hypothetical protein
VTGVSRLGRHGAQLFSLLRLTRRPTAAKTLYRSENNYVSGWPQLRGKNVEGAMLIISFP